MNDNKRFINIQSIFTVKDNITGEEYRYRYGVLDEELIDCMNKLYEENQLLKQDNLMFFQSVFNILLKYQDLFNQEMADEVLEELGIELTKWFE